MNKVKNKKYLFEMEIFCNIINVFIVTFDQLMHPTVIKIALALSRSLSIYIYIYMTSTSGMNANSFSLWDTMPTDKKKKKKKKTIA